VNILFYHTMKYSLYSFQLLVTCNHIELLLIHAIHVIPQAWVLNQIPSPSSYACGARTAITGFPLQWFKMYYGMLQICHLPSRSTDSPLQIIGYISGSWVSPIVLTLLLLCSWFLSTFILSTIMSLNRNIQQSGWIVSLVEYSPGCRESLMWRVAWHHMCSIG